jgi:signal transduction histidine kinase
VTTVPVATSVAGPAARVTLGPLVRLLLNTRVVALFLVAASVPSDRSDVALAATAVMAATSVLPVLLWRRVGGYLLRHPAWSALDLGLGVLVLVVAGVGGPFPLYVLSTAAVVGVLHGRTGGLLLTTPLVGAYLVGAVRSGEPQTLVSLLLFPVLLVGSTLFAAELRRLLLERDDAISSARRSLVRAATAEERARLSRELHDSVAKTLHGLAMSAASLPLLAQRDPDRAAAEAARIREAAERASGETRQLLRGLRVDDVTVPLAESIEAAARSWSAETGIAVDLHLDAGDEPSLEVRYELFQIAREALRNVAAHAAASLVEVRLRRDGGGLTLTIVDDGVGFDPAPLEDLARAGHIGVVALHERSATVGGSTRLTSAPGDGTRVEVTVPLQPLLTGGDA